MGAAAHLTRRVNARSTPILFAALVGVLIGPLDLGLVGVALPTMTRSFGDDIRASQAVVVVYLTALALAYIPAGRLGDRVSHARILRGGAVLFAFGAITVSLAPALLPLLAGRLLQGLGAAGMAAAGQALAFAASGIERSGRNLGLVHAAVALGMLAGPLLGGLMLERYPWPALFLVEPPLVLGAALLIRGAEGAKDGEKSTVRSLLQRRELALGLAIAVLTFVAMSANMFVVPYLLQRPLGLSPVAAGALMAVVPAAILLAGVPSGALSDRYASRWPAAVGLGLVTVGIVGLAGAAFVSVWWAAAVALLIYGFGAALFQAPNNRAILRAAPAGALGLASGLLGASRQAGQVLGVLISGALLRTGPAGLDDAGTYAVTFLALSAVAAATTAIALARGPSA